MTRSQPSANCRSIAATHSCGLPVALAASQSCGINVRRMLQLVGRTDDIEAGHAD